MDGMLYFTAYTPSNGVELWQSDGTPAGTVQVADIYPGPGSSSPVQLAATNGTLFFAAADSTRGYGLWKLAPDSDEPSVPRLQWPTISRATVNPNSVFGSDWLRQRLGCDRLVKRHAGIDIVVAKGKPVYAAETGIVRVAEAFSSRNPDAKGWTTVEHFDDEGREYTTLYWHVVPLVRADQPVARGMPIGKVADMGRSTHLHFGVRAAPYDAVSNHGALPRTQACPDGNHVDPQFPGLFQNPLDYLTTPLRQRSARTVNRAASRNVDSQIDESSTGTLEPPRALLPNADFFLRTTSKRKREDSRLDELTQATRRSVNPHSRLTELSRHPHEFPATWSDVIDAAILGEIPAMEPSVGRSD